MHLQKSQALNRIETWEEWKKELKIQFQSTDTYDRAKTDLFRIQQGKSQSVQGYTEKFLSLLNIVSDLAEKDLMHIFREGLQSALKIEVIKQAPMNIKQAPIILPPQDHQAGTSLGTESTSLHLHRIKGLKVNKRDSRFTATHPAGEKQRNK